MALLDALKGTPNPGQPLAWLLTAGQPSAEQLAAVRAAGVTTVIDLRDPMEPRSFDEPATAASLGLDYINIPVTTGALDPASLTAILDVLHRQEGTPTLLHCASANRVGGALLPWFVNEQGLDEQAAVDAAMRVGLRSAELMEWGLGYAREQGKK